MTERTKNIIIFHFQKSKTSFINILNRSENMSAQFANNIENNISERRNLLDISNEDEDDDGIEIRIDNHTTDYNINNEETPLINAHPDDKLVPI